MIKFLNTVCLVALCLHNQLFAGEAIRALSTLKAQLQELTTILATDVAAPSLDPRVMSAQETLAYMQQSGGEIKLTAAQEQELQAVAAKERKEQVQKEEVLAEVLKVPHPRRTQFLKEVTALFDRTFAALKASENPKDIYLWNRYRENVLETYREHAVLQDKLGAIEKSFSDIGKRPRQALAEEALLMAMSYEIAAVPQDSKTAQAVHEFLSQKEARALGKALKLPTKAIARTGKIIETTKLPQELAGIVSGYDIPVFKGEKIREFSVGKSPLNKLLALSEKEIIVGVDDRDLYVVTIPDGESAEVVREHFTQPRSGKIGCLMPSGAVVIVSYPWLYSDIIIFDPKQRKFVVTKSTLSDNGLIFEMVPVSDGVLVNWDRGIYKIQQTLSGKVEVEQLPYAQTVEINSIAVLDNGNIAYAVFDRVSMREGLKIVDLKTGKTTELLDHRSVIQSMRLAPLTGQRLISYTDGIEVWDVSEEALSKSKHVPRFFESETFITQLIELPDGQIAHNGSIIKVADQLNAWEVLTLLNPDTGESRILDPKSVVAAFAVDPQSGHLFVGYRDGTVSIWR